MVREGIRHDYGRFVMDIGIQTLGEKPGYFEILIYYVIASFVREAWKVTGFRT
jgi:hypothetical protein